MSEPARICRGGASTARWQLVAVVVVSVLLLSACSGGKARPRGARAPSTTSTTSAATTTTLAVSAYVVKRGDTLTSIAKQFRVSAAKIMAANGITAPDRLTEGQSLQIPPPPPLQLRLAPATGPPGQAFKFTLTGAQPAEAITFEVDSPKATFTGGAHTASDDGAVEATYQTSLSDVPGTYNVVVHGNMGTTARASFAVLAETPTT